MKKFLTMFAFLIFSIAVHAQAFYVAGGFNGWCSTCNAMTTSGDGIFTCQVTIATPGRYEWKATTADWSINYPGSNSWVITTSPDQVVTFTLNTNTISDNWMPTYNIINANDNPGPVVAVGDWQGWNNAGTQVMHDDGLEGDAVAGDGIFTYHAVIASAGSYQYKPVVQGSWDAWGTDNRNINASTQAFTTTIPNQNVYLYLDKNTGRISSSASSLALHLDFTGMIEGLVNETNSKMTPDTVTVELRASASPYNLVESQTGLLDSNGYRTFYFSTAVNSVPYWFVVKHRNTLETWSLAPVVLSSSPIFDFTWSQGSAYTDGGGISPLILKGGKWCFYSGDVNQDGGIDLTDLIAVSNDNLDGTPGIYSHFSTDVNGDGGVDLSDLIIVSNNNIRGVYSQFPSSAAAKSELHHVNPPMKNSQ